MLIVVILALETEIAMPPLNFRLGNELYLYAIFTSPMLRRLSL